MVLANTRDGKTQSFDISTEDQFRSLLGLLVDGSVTALSILQNGVQQSLPRPRRFKKPPVYGVEQVLDSNQVVVGERIFAHIEDVRVSLTSTFSSKMVRCDLAKLGIMQYNPNQRS